MVVHSTTKYLGGHGDVVGGIVIGKADDDLFKKIKQVQTTYGSVPSPFDCWLITRSLRTLPLRMSAHSASGATIAAFLADHPKIESVHYPGLESHPGHAIASRQMASFGGMVSIQVKGDEAAAMNVAAKAQLFTRATSLGSTESLIEHRASIEDPTPRLRRIFFACL